MMAPRLPEIRRAYGFDEVAIVPGRVTINPDQTSTEFSVDGLEDYTGQGTPSMDPADGGEQNGGQSSLLETDATDVPGDSHPAESDLAPLGTDDER